MIQEEIHKRLVDNCATVMTWFDQKSEGLQFPFYSSFDIRDAGDKLAPVDANIFPAGFNNICDQDKEAAADVVKAYLDDHYPKVSSHIVLVAEEHTNNSYYWENVHSIVGLLKAAGREVQVTLPRRMDQDLQVQTSSGRQVLVSNYDSASSTAGLIISNNDFSDAHEDWANTIKTPLNPPRELGWYRRRKDHFFSEYNQLSSEFGELLGMDPFLFRIQSQSFDQFDVASEQSREQLAQCVQNFLDDLQASYKANGINREAFAFVKNNSGTYGLAVIKVSSADDILNWNYKSRKKMKAAKGGHEVSNLLIQEGIPTRFNEGGVTAEPCVYTVGSQLVGGFLRTHSKKSDQDNLNSPGAVYKKLCMSDMEVDMAGCPLEAVYGWVSRLGALAIAREARTAGIRLGHYQ